MKIELREETKRDEVCIREAKIADASMIAGFNVKMAEETEGKHLNRKIVLEGVKTAIRDPDKGFYLVAEKSGKTLVGQLMITYEWSDWRNMCYWWIQSVYVEKRFRRQKVFSRLHARAAEMAKSRKDIAGLRLYVEKRNNRAKQVYRSLGFSLSSYEVYEMEF